MHNSETILPAAGAVETAANIESDITASAAAIESESAAGMQKDAEEREREHNSKQAVIKTIVFMAVLLFMNLLARILLMDDSLLRSNIARVSGNTYQDVFIGTSQCRAAVDPDTVSEITGRTTTNASVPLSSALDQYYLVRQMCLSGHAPERIFYEVDPYYLMETRCGGLSYCYPMGLNRLQYFLAGTRNDWRISTSPWTFNIRNYFQMDKVAARWWDYKVNGYDQSYHGFIYNTSSFHASDNYDRAFVVSDTADLYMNKLIRYCKENGIELVLMQTPVSETVYLEYEKEFRSGADAYLAALAQENGITYRNFNLDPEYSFAADLKGYIDTEGHMLGEVAEEFSEKLAGEIK